MSTKSAIVCNTPLQVLGAINIVVNDVENTRCATDVFVVSNFTNADVVIQNLIQSGCFSNVYQCKLKPKDEKQNKVKTFYKLFNGTALFKDYVFNNIDFMKNEYGKIFVGDNNTLGIALKHISKNAETVIYDDGLDSYIGNCITGRVGKAYRFFGKPLRLGVFSYQITSLYVNNDSFCQSTVSPNIHQLPLLTSENKAIKIAREVFSFQKASPIRSHRFILLGQPLKGIMGYNGKLLSEVLDQIGDSSSEFLLRAHPRQKCFTYSGIQRDEVNNLWELECISNIESNHVLIGFYSTAQIAPKMIVDKEPFIIFLYKLFLGHADTSDAQNYAKVIAALQQNYRCKNKIFIPESIEEYYAIIQNLQK